MSARACDHARAAWQPAPGGMLERRCVCGDVERATYESVNGDALERLGIVLAAWRRAFPEKEPPP
jgi:hypothetical protein